jgi:hypothetical protein
MSRAWLARAARLSLVLAAASALTGCLAIAAGAAVGYGAFKASANGDSRSYTATLPATWHATLALLRENGYPIADTAPLGPTGGHVSMNGASVDVSKESETSTRVAVSFGTFDSADHRMREDQFLDALGARLGVRP